MAYKYEEPLTKKFNEEYRAGRIPNLDLFNELKEVYAKAKAFNEIRKYVNKKLEEEEFPIEDDYLIGRYESYEIIEEIIKENMEDE
ncbi:hypothetical protein [Mammaliicoccus sciuri]|uniref:hypothetical protein n=1 Tax=Mammaliicoccus sciuri TaxID=1296 RepID=UPI0034DCC84A